MAATLLDGPLGNDGRHTINSFTMMDLSVLADHSALPYVVVDVITGLHDMADADDPRDSNNNQIGETPYLRLLKGKTLVYNGRVIANSLQQLRQVVTAFRGALSNCPSDTTLAIAPHPSVGGVTLTAYGRPLACNVDDRQDNIPGDLPSAWQRKFVMSFRLRDPRFFDLASGDAITGAAASGSTATLVAVGNAPLEPVFAVAAPGGVVTLTHVGMGRKVTFRSDLPAGALVVDFMFRTARIGTRDVFGFIDWPNTDWWEPGVPGLIPATNNVVKADGGTWSVSAAPGTW